VSENHKRFALMPLAVLDEPFDHDGFFFELKYDVLPQLSGTSVH